MDEVEKPAWFPTLKRRWQLARLVGRADSAREAYLAAGVPEADVEAVEEVFEDQATWASPCRACAGVDGGAHPAWVRDVFGMDRVLVNKDTGGGFSVWLAFDSTARDSEVEADIDAHQLSTLTGAAWAVVATTEVVLPTDLGWAAR